MSLGLDFQAVLQLGSGTAGKLGAAVELHRLRSGWRYQGENVSGQIPHKSFGFRLQAVIECLGLVLHTVGFQGCRCHTSRRCKIGCLAFDLYEIAVFEETIGFSGDDIMFAINIPQESVVVPETMDAIRAAIPMQKERLQAVGLTNQYLGMA